jgi:thioredoxin-dependent peroxiredoxin
MIKSGETAPDFELPAFDGRTFRLGDRRGKESVVLYFYPKDNTPGCTVEARAFRDRYQTFAAAGAEVVGVSSDSLESHRRFAAKHDLPFPLLSDGEGTVRKLYGVEKTLGLIPGRATFVIDKDGIVRHAFASQLEVGRHVDGALAALTALAPLGPTAPPRAAK